MTKNIKCYRCGKEYDLNYKDISEQIKCSHCNGIMSLDLNSQRKVRYIRYALVLVVALLMSFLVYQLNLNNLVIFGILTLVLLFTINYVDKFCLYLASLIFKLNYVEFHPEDIEKANKKRQLEKEKAKRLKAQKRIKK